MKKILFLALSTLALNSTQAQVTAIASPDAFTSSDNMTNVFSPSFFQGKTANKTTGLSDTLYYTKNSTQTTGPWIYYVADQTTTPPVDSGRLYGTSYLGHKGFAELYRNIDRATPADTTLTILGVLYLMGGRVQTGSTKAISFNIWKRDTASASNVAVTNRPKFFIYGLPASTTVASKSLTFSQLTLNSLTPTYFATALSGVNYDFYAGFSLTYTWSSMGGDTVGAINTQATSSNIYTVNGSGDTLLSANNVIQTSANVWRSAYYNLSYGSGLTDLVILPIIKLSCANCWPTSVNGFKRNNLTFYGNFPNPANNSTTVRVALKNNADVTITVMDIAGKTVKTVEAKGLTAGTNDINVATAQLAAGNYTYMVRTSEGDAVASQLTVIK